MGKPGDRKTILVSGSLVAAGLRDRVGKHQAHGNLCFVPSSFFCRARCRYVTERTPDEMQGHHGDFRGKEEIWEKILDKNVNEVNVMTSTTGLRCFQ